MLSLVLLAPCSCSSPILQMATLTGRVLDAPSIEYAGGKAATINKANPGKWFQDKNMYVAAEKVGSCHLNYAF